MSADPVSKDEVALALQTGRELGPDYEDAVAAALAERLDRTIEERVRAEVARQTHADTAGERQGHSTALGVSAFFSLLFAAPMSFALLDRAGLAGLVVLWTGIVLLNLVVARAGHRR